MRREDAALWCPVNGINTIPMRPRMTSRCRTRDIASMVDWDNIRGGCVCEIGARRYPKNGGALGTSSVESVRRRSGVDNGLRTNLLLDNCWVYIGISAHFCG